MIEDLFGAQLLPLTLTALAFLALAGWLLVLGIGDRANRAFAALLAFLGLLTMQGVLLATGPPPRLAFFLVRILLYLLVPMAFYLVAFLSLFPRRRGLGRSPLAMGLFVAAGVAICAWYLLDHSVYVTIAPADGDAPTAGGGLRYSSYGPLAAFIGLRRPLLALAAVILARDYHKDPGGSGGFSTFLLFAGFAINAVFDGVTFTTNLVQDLADGSSALRQPGAWMQLALPALTLPIVVVALAYIARAARHERHDASLQEARRFLTYVLPAVAFSGFAISFRPWAAAMADAMPFLIGLWRLVVPLLLAYALLRYSLFSIDIHLKANVRRGILVALFVGVFFLISEAAEAIVSEDKAPIFGVVSAGLLAVLAKPIQSFAERAANGVMPDTQPVERLGSQGRFKVYRDQFLLVQQDGHVSPKERRMLGRLAQSLGISNDEAMDLEAGITPTRDDPAPPRQRPSVSRVARTAIAVVGTGAVFGAVSAVLEGLAGASSFQSGLATAAVVALLLGPIESIAERLTARRAVAPASEAAMREAIRDAWADGHLSERDVAYLASLQKRLGIGQRDRRRIEREVLDVADGRVRSRDGPQKARRA